MFRNELSIYSIPIYLCYALAKACTVLLMHFSSQMNSRWRYHQPLIPWKQSAWMKQAKRKRRRSLKRPVQMTAMATADVLRVNANAMQALLATIALKNVGFYCTVFILFFIVWIFINVHYPFCEYWFLRNSNILPLLLHHRNFKIYAFFYLILRLFEKYLGKGE